MDHLFEFTSSVTKEFFRLVTQEGITSYEEDDGKLATLAVKNALAKRDFTVVNTTHYHELLDGQWIGEPVVLHNILDRYEALQKADDKSSCEALALHAIEEVLAERGSTVVRSDHYSRLVSARVLPSPRILAEIVDRYNKIKAESPGANRHTLAMDAIEHALAERDKSVMDTSVLAELNELADREQIAVAQPETPPVVVVTKEGAVFLAEPGGTVVVNDYRKGDACEHCESFFLFEDLMAVYKTDERGILLNDSKYHMCMDCIPKGNDAPL